MYYIRMSNDSVAEQRHRIRNWFYENEPDPEFLPGRFPTIPKQTYKLM